MTARDPGVRGGAPRRGAGRGAGEPSRWRATRRIGSAARRRCCCPPASDDVGRRVRAGARGGRPLVRPRARLEHPAARRGPRRAGHPDRQGTRRDCSQDGERWTVGAGLPAPLAARRTAAAGCAGLHNLVGVPGTVGGGVLHERGLPRRRLVGGRRARAPWWTTPGRTRVAGARRHPVQLPAERARRPDRAGDEVRLRPEAQAALDEQIAEMFDWRQKGRRSTSRAAAACSGTRRARAGSGRADRARRGS